MSLPSWFTIKTAIPLGRVNLTPDDISAIIDKIPDPPGVGRSAIKNAKDATHKHLQMTLSRVKLIRDQRQYSDIKTAILAGDRQAVTNAYSKFDIGIEFNEASVRSAKRLLNRAVPRAPDPRALKEFTDSLVRSYEDSYIAPGSNVGNLAGLALGQPISQMMLSAFHTTNESLDDSSENFPRLTTILNASQNNSFPKSFLYFKRDGDASSAQDILHIGEFNDVYNMKREFEEVSVEGVLKSAPMIVDASGIELLPQIVDLQMRLFPDRPINEAIVDGMCIVIEVDPFQMYFYNLSMAKVAGAIERDTSYVCVWSSQSVRQDSNAGRIFILPTEDNADNSTMYTEVVNRMRDMIVSGYRGIEKLLPIKQDTLSAVQDVLVLDNAWTVFVDAHRTRVTGISLADVNRTVSSIYNSRIVDGNIEIDINDHIKTLAGKTVRKVAPASWIIEETMKSRFSGFNIRAIGARIIATIDDPLTYVRTTLGNSLYRYFYGAFTRGINLNIMHRPDIDQTRFRTNDMNQMQSVYGMYSTKFMATNECSEIILGISDSTNASYIALLMDTLFQTGVLTGITHKGAKNRGASIIGLSSLDRALKVFLDASVMGALDKTNDSAGKMHIGQPGNFGTGVVTVRTDTDRPEEPETFSVLDAMDLFDDDGDEQEEKRVETVPPLEHQGVTTAADLGPIVAVKKPVIDDMLFKSANNSQRRPISFPEPFIVTSNMTDADVEDLFN